MLDGRFGADIDAGAVPVLPGALELAHRGVVPGGTRRNLEHVTPHTDFGTADPSTRLLLADAQTSGGLLIASAQDRLDGLLENLAAARTPAAAVVGRLVAGPPGRIRVSGEPAPAPS
jgi:selenide,water dikinase